MTNSDSGRFSRFGKSISAIDLFFVAISALPLGLFLLHPTAFEVTLWMGAEIFEAAIMPFWEPFLYLWYDPSARPFFPELNADHYAKASVEERLELYQLLVRFPRKRATYWLFAGYLVLIPAVFVIVVIWDYPHPWYVQAARVAFWITMNITVASGLFFNELTDYVSETIAELHRRQDWTEVFKRAPSDRDPRTEAFAEAALLIAVSTQILLGQWVTMSASHEYGTQAARQLVVIGAFGVAVLGRIWYVTRRRHQSVLLSIFDALEGNEPRGSHGTLPLVTSPLLARFQQTVNALSRRLKDHERELSHWVSTRTEEQRFLALAEISALVVHDLSSPLQAIQLAADQAANDRDRNTLPECLGRIHLNSKRALELVNALRTYLRASAPPERGALFGEVYAYVHRILSTRFLGSRFTRINWELDPALESLRLDVSRADLIHVLVNLLANSVENLLGKSHDQATLRLRLEDLTAERALITIHDNGTGLSPEKFEELTGFALLAARDSGTSRSLGLRLVRRLVERQGGSLNVAAPEHDSGTRFVLKLRPLPPGEAARGS